MGFTRKTILALALLLSACGPAGSQFHTPGEASAGGATAPAPITNGTQVAPIAGINVMSLTVNGSLCSSSTSQGYPNKPCVSVTVCDPSGGNCQTISDILLDTGSSGLRVFSSVLNTALANVLTPLTSGGKTITECTAFGDGSSDWGPVETATIRLGGESPVRAPIQVINSAFSDSATYCSGADTDPAAAGFNGILGVGLFAQDCGSSCVTSDQNKNYYACSGNTCSGIAVSLAQQVTNPATLLPQDNNGVVIQLPSVAPGGAPSATGNLVLGIGTRANNQPSGVRAYPANPSLGEFTTTFQGTTFSGSFLDTGSSGMYFSTPASLKSQLPDCGSTDTNAAGWDCPASALAFSATNIGASGGASSSVPFRLGNFVALWKSPTNSVFSEIGGSLDDSGQSFDWGLPFFLGRNVYVGFEGKASSLASGTYWAY